jgi:serine O-acetyltransferase
MKRKSENLLKLSSKQSIRKRMDFLITGVIESYEKEYSIDHIGKYPLPSRNKIINILKDIIDILFPGYFTNDEINKLNLNYYIGNKVNTVFEELSSEIAKSYRHEHFQKNNSCEPCEECYEQCIETGFNSTFELLEAIPEIRRKLSLDVKAAFDGDPAAKSYNEIVFSYPGLYAITAYRIANLLYEKEVPLIPRIICEYSHNLTGIDIHPGAKIGESFFIDHGTGVVIGETTTIGDNVKIYQGVTLGALSFPKDEKGNIIKGKKRHPTIEDNVTIYSGATILGGNTVIGRDSVIGGNTWTVESIPSGSRVLLSDIQTKMTIKTANKNVL